MNATVRLLKVVVVGGTAGLLAVGCASTPPPPPVKAAPAGPPPISAGEVAGPWTGAWGNMVLRATGNEIRGTYDNNQGTILGTFDAASASFKGWWCEAPSRHPSDEHAGEVELRFARTGQTGSLLSVDGRWRYGTDKPWNENWDLLKAEGSAPAQLEMRLDDTASFCPHP